ncbi:MAG: tetratricopeptide repeat protein [Chitinophagales bacterium]|nr:tetratricopeptide repeat protein [Chitinophagales bacterium]
MKLGNAIKLLLLIAGLQFLHACSAPKEGTATAPKDGAPDAKATVDEARLREAEAKLIEAKKMELLGDEQAAMGLYKECIRLDPGNDAAFYDAATILFRQKQYQEALAYVAQAVKLQPENSWYLDLYGTLLGGIGNYKEAVKVYQQMVQLDQDNTDAWFNWAFFLDQNRQTEEAINVFNKIEARFGVNEDISLEKEKMWLKLGKVDKAADELNNLIAAFPDEPRYYAMLVDLYMANKMEDKAFVVLQQMISIDPDNPRANLVMADYYRKKGEQQKSFDALERAFANPELQADVKISMLATFLPLMQTDTAAKSEALVLGKLLVSVHPGDPMAHALLGDILYQHDQVDEALDEYKQSLEIDNSRFMVWQQVMLLYDREQNRDSLLAVSNRAVELFPDQGMAYYFNGYANMQLKKYSDAIASLGKAAAMGSEDKQFIAQLYSFMGDAYFSLQNATASDSCYELALVFDPQNAYVLNNYSYYLSLRGMKLDEAKKMAERANNLAPNTAAYEDTYGWVLYKLGEYASAKEWIEKSLKNGSADDGTVLEHYGDVLFKLGDVDGAVQYWMKAKEKHVESETIDRKIAGRKMYD